MWVFVTRDRLTVDGELRDKTEAAAKGDTSDAFVCRCCTCCCTCC